MKRPTKMPELARFYGIVIRMYPNDHNPPHFHATYGEHEAVIELDTWEVKAGWIPARGLRLVREWASLHSRELRANWELTRQGKPTKRIAPLD